MKRIVYPSVIVLLLTMVLSCNHADKGEHDHDHHHNLMSYTTYSDRLELYAQATPMVVGEACEWTLHLTRLADFKPLDSAVVRASLLVGGKVCSKTLDATETTGIYICSLTPTQGGCGHLQVTVEWSAGSDTLHFDHIHVADNHETLHEHGHGGEHHSHDEEHAPVANAITFTKEQSWKIDFATAELKAHPFGMAIKTSAQVLPAQGDGREAVAAASGITVYHNAALAEGIAVKAGQVLLTIESNGMADNNMNVRLQEATANYTLAKEEYERKQKLAADKIVSQSDLQRARAAFETAQATYNNLKSNFSSQGAVVRAPISGYIQSIHVSNGGFVEAGRSVATISKNRDMMLRAEVPSRHYPQLAHIEGVNVQIPNTGQTYTLQELGGSLLSYGHATHSDCPLVPVTFRLHNNGQLLSGSFVTLYITTSSTRDVLTIPNTGIVEEMGNHFVFVQITPETFEKRLVTLGTTDGRCSEIRSGVNEGERVVTRGASMVRLVQNAGALDPHAGHVH